MLSAGTYLQRSRRGNAPQMKVSHDFVPPPKCMHPQLSDCSSQLYFVHITWIVEKSKYYLFVCMLCLQISRLNSRSVILVPNVGLGFSEGAITE